MNKKKKRKVDNNEGSIYKSIKVPLEKIIKKNESNGNLNIMNSETFNIINEKVIDIHKLTIYTYQFIKSYYLDHYKKFLKLDKKLDEFWLYEYPIEVDKIKFDKLSEKKRMLIKLVKTDENNKPLKKYYEIQKTSKINRRFIENVMIVLRDKLKNSSKNNGDDNASNDANEKNEYVCNKAKDVSKNLKNKLETYYDNHFKNLVKCKIIGKNLTQLIKTTARDIAPNFENNIILNFEKYMKRITRGMFEDAFNKANKPDILEELKKSSIKIELTKDQKKEYNKTFFSILTDSLNDDNYKTEKMFMGVNCHELIDKIRKYRPLLIDKKKCILYDVKRDPYRYYPYMINIGIYLEEREDAKVNTNNERMFKVFPQRNNCIPKHINIDSTGLLEIFPFEDKDKTRQNLSREVMKKLWNSKFNIENYLKKRCRLTRQKKRRKFVFNCEITTDGISATILMIKNNHFGEKNPKVGSKKKGDPFPYIDELSKEERKKLEDSKLLACDPGKRNLLYITDCFEYDKKNTYSYTNIRRRFEAKVPQFTKKRKQLEEKSIELVGSDKLSNYNSKTLNIDKYKSFVRMKNIMNYFSFDEYEKHIYRKLKLKSYMNVQKSESKLLNEMKNKYKEDNKETVILFGNWDQPKQMRNFVPTPGIRLKRLLARIFKIIMIDEYKTSKLCHSCKNETETFLKIKNPNKKKAKKNPELKFHGLLRCKNANCCKIWNRDYNGSLNILEKGTTFIKEGKYPKDFKR